MCYHHVLMAGEAEPLVKLRIRLKKIHRRNSPHRLFTGTVTVPDRVPAPGSVLRFSVLIG